MPASFRSDWTRFLVCLFALARDFKFIMSGFIPSFLGRDLAILSTVPWDPCVGGDGTFLLPSFLLCSSSLGALLLMCPYEVLDSWLVSWVDWAVWLALPFFHRLSPCNHHPLPKSFSSFIHFTTRLFVLSLWYMGLFLASKWFLICPNGIWTILFLVSKSTTGEA